jgi:hypothetical protein
VEAGGEVKLDLSAFSHAISGRAGCHTGAASKPQGRQGELAMAKRPRSRRGDTKRAARPAGAAGKARTADAVPEPSPRKPLHRRATTWLAGIVVAILAGALTTYGQTFLGSFLSSKASPDELGQQAGAPDAIRVVDVHLTGFNDHLLPSGLTDEALNRWDRAGGAPDSEWLEQQGAVEVGQADWEITLEGRRSTAVEVVDMRPVLAGPCTAPIPGSLIENPAAGATDKIPLYIQIDKPNAAFVTRSVDDDDQMVDTPFFADRKITLPKGERNVIVLESATEHSYCRWRVAVDYIADGTRQRMTISAPDGKPFAVTGRLDPQSYSDVFLSPVGYGCSNNPYRRVSGREYAQLIAAAAYGQCPR